MGVFSENAPRLWAAGLSAIPLVAANAVDRDGEPRPARGKRPAIKGWQEFASRLPSEQEQVAFLSAYPDGNVGLALGPSSGVVVVDVDSDDPRVIEVIQQVAGPSPWVRVGRKGAAIAYRYTDEAIFRVDQMVGEERERIVEVLGKGAQVVLPPSIHPSTGQPYVAHADLIDVLDKLTPLPGGFEEKLRFGLMTAGFELAERATKTRVGLSARLGKGQRDVGLTQKAGSLAGMVHRGDYTLQRAIDEMSVQIHDYVDTTDGEIDVAKHIENIVKFIKGDIDRTGKGLPRGWDEGLAEEYEAFAVELRSLGITVEGVQAEIQKAIAENPRGLDDEQLINIAARIATTEMSPTEVGLVKRQISKAGVKLSEFDQFFLKPALAEARQKRSGTVDLPKEQLPCALHYIDSCAGEGGLMAGGGCLMRWVGSHWVGEASQTSLRKLQDTYGSVISLNSDFKAIYDVILQRVYEEVNARDVFYGVNFRNGFLDAEGELHPHAPGQRQTYVLPFDYKPEAAEQMRAWPKFLHDCWGDDPDYAQKVKALQFAFCMTLLGRGPVFQTAVLLKGVARSGKSTILQLLQQMLPPETCSALSPTDWTDKKMLPELEGKLINQVFDLSEREHFPGGQFKTLVDGSELTANPKYQKPYKFKPRATLWFGSNHDVQTADTSAGFTRRWLILHFSKQVPIDQVDVGLIDKLLAEREGIFAWAMEIRGEVMNASAVPHPPSGLEAVRSMYAQNNPVYEFMIGNSVEIDETSNALAGAVYDRFRSSLVSKNRWKQLVDETVFHRMMRDLGSEMGFKATDHGYQGLKLVTGLTLAA